ncbi:MAG: zf-HC2 domain-containing protein [Acidobacteria bacterium]|nr:zf-HC2 domain-containing protein [Acidobacteriota bacterium]
MGEVTLLSCSNVRKQLPDFLDGAVDVNTAQQMRWHFGRCNDCRMIVRSAMDTFRQFFPEKRAVNSLHKTHAA